MRRGEVWTAAGSGYLSKPKPVVIIQSDEFRDFDSLVVCLLTTQERLEGSQTRVRIEPSMDNGLDVVSYAMTEKIVTLRAERLGRRVGILSAHDMDAISRQIAIVLGLS